MRRKISRSFFFSTFVILILTLSLIMGFLYTYFGNLREDQLKEALDLTATAVESYGTEYLGKLPGDGSRFTWIAADGTVLYDTQADAEAMENHATREEVAEALSSGSGKSRRYSATLLRQTIYYAVRLEDGTVLRASIESATVLTLLLGMYQSVVLILIVMAVAAAFIGKRLSKRIIAPLDRLDLDMPLENNNAYPEFAPLLRRIDEQNREICRQVIKLRKKTDEYNRIIENMHDGLVILDNNWHILSISRSAMEIFGSHGGCVGKDFLCLNRDSSVAAQISEAYTSGSGELDYVRDGKAYHFSITRTEFDGKTIGTVILITDITDRRRAEQSRKEFTANVNHELKTPIQNILGHADLIVHGKLNEEDTHRFAQCIQREASRMSALVDDIIHLSRLDEGCTAAPEEVNLWDTAAQIRELLQAEAAEKSVSVEISGGHAVISAPHTQVHEILFNLCSNAIRYNKDGGNVYIHIEDGAEYAAVTIRDTGIGIPAEDIDRIFERFFRVDKSRSRATGGTGLGLSIVKHAAQIIGAQVSVKSTEGEGSEFTVKFYK